MSDDTFLMILTGNDRTKGDEAIKQAVAERFIKIRDKVVRNEEGHLYDGNRCRPENLGWRLLQNCRIGFGTKKGTIITVEKINEGLLDVEIIETFHEAARAENWYAVEKDWG